MVYRFLLLVIGLRVCHRHHVVMVYRFKVYCYRVKLKGRPTWLWYIGLRIHTWFNRPYG